MRFNEFYDPRYNAESYIEFDPEDVVTVENTTKHLFLGGMHLVTAVTLKNGAQYLLQGHQASAIREAQSASTQK